MRSHRRTETLQNCTKRAPRFLLATLVATTLISWGCSGSKRPTPGTTVPVVRSSDPTLAAAGLDPADPFSAASARDNGSGRPLLNEYTYRLTPGDLIDVKFPYHPEENERVPVRPDGKISLQVATDIEAAGKSPKELEQIIEGKASATLRNPVVSIVVAQLAEHKVYVGGDVAKPGFVLYRDGLTPLQAVMERGGFLDTAKTDEVILVPRGQRKDARIIDLESVMDGEAGENVVLSPDDVVVVPRTWIGKADIWVDQWIRGLLPTVPRAGFDLNQAFSGL
jgi:protein involved in polysaccharide export with SLBB domain